MPAGAIMGAEFIIPNQRNWTKTDFEYDSFLEHKKFTPIVSGLTDIPPLNPAMFPHQRDVTSWALRLGRAAAFLGTGMGKTLIEEEWARIVSEHTGMPVLILAPLAVAYQMVTEGAKFGIEVKYCKHQSDMGDSRIIVTNYERMDSVVIPPT
jgi:replicative superfamily II helicase